MEWARPTLATGHKTNGLVGDLRQRDGEIEIGIILRVVAAGAEALDIAGVAPAGEAVDGLPLEVRRGRDMIEPGARLGPGPGELGAPRLDP